MSLIGGGVVRGLDLGEGVGPAAGGVGELFSVGGGGEGCDRVEGEDFDDGGGGEGLMNGLGECAALGLGGTAGTRGLLFVLAFVLDCGVGGDPLLLLLLPLVLFPPLLWHLNLLQSTGRAASETCHSSDRGWQRPLEAVEADVKHCELLEESDLVSGQAAGEVVIHENDLVEGVAHLANAARDATTEVIVGEDQHRHRRVAEVLRDPRAEPVVVEEDGIKVLVEQLGRNWPLELVEPEIKELEGRQRQHHLGEGPNEAVVADVKLMKELHAAECFRDNAAEAVGVEVEEGKVSEEAQLGREVAGDVCVVEVDTCHHPHGWVGRRRGAEDAGVGADIGAIPVGSEVEGVGEDGGLPCLECNVGLPEPLVLETEPADVVAGIVIVGCRRADMEKQREEEDGAN
ncbi:hypothetical protein RJ640_025553 [Escallonia rubra]|uniref:Uncharacterized protein n=1 Tax=Escallonia rubra TaxID=112253 RepID=A0AA88QQ73_9ASTE|nr:hypothetical protein RJ640_025553 [Escallonia rubra]